MILSMHTYNGYKVTVRTPLDSKPQVDVYDPRFPKEPSLYRTTSLDLAMRWIDAYRKGVIWATQEMRTASKPLYIENTTNLFR